MASGSGSRHALDGTREPARVGRCAVAQTLASALRLCRLRRLLLAEVRDGQPQALFQRSPRDPAQLLARTRAVEAGKMHVSGTLGGANDRGVTSDQADKMAVQLVYRGREARAQTVRSVGSAVQRLYAGLR